MTQGWPVSLEMSQTVQGSPEIVWDLITEWENQGDWMLEASDFVVTSEAREGVGVESEATVRIGGIAVRDKVRVDAWEVRRHLGIEHLGWVSGRGDIYLTAIGDDRTHVFWREQLRPPLGLAGSLSLMALKPLMQRVFARDLKVLGGLVRARAAASSRSRRRARSRVRPEGQE